MYTEFNEMYEEVMDIHVDATKDRVFIEIYKISIYGKFVYTFDDRVGMRIAKRLAQEGYIINTSIDESNKNRPIITGRITNKGEAHYLLLEL